MSCSPQASLNCRESPPPLASKYARHARISQYSVHKPDCRECAAQQRWGFLSLLFSGKHMRSPVSSRALGEWNAIMKMEGSATHIDPVAMQLKTNLGVALREVQVIARYWIGKEPKERPSLPARLHVPSAINCSARR
jgi:hypothetical protein